MIDVEKNELTELVLIAKNLDKRGLTILKSQANILLSYEQLKREEKRLQKVTEASQWNYYDKRYDCFKNEQGKRKKKKYKEAKKWKNQKKSKLFL